MGNCGVAVEVIGGDTTFGGSIDCIRTFVGGVAIGESFVLFVTSINRTSTCCGKVLLFVQISRILRDFSCR